MICTSFCVPENQDKCVGPNEPGPCKNFVYKWWYNTTSKECATFLWGGCEGNAPNRFNTEAECMYHCLGEPRRCIYIFVLIIQLRLCPTYIDTLPTYLQTTTKDPAAVTEAPLLTTTFGSAAAAAAASGSTDIPRDQPVPNDLRGSELTFEETGHEKTFLFAQDNTFIQMDGDLIQTFQLR